MQRLAALARRGRDGTLPDRVRMICETSHVHGLIEVVRREAFRQERVVQGRPRRPTTALTVDQRRWRLVELVLGPPERWTGEHSQYVDAAISAVMVLAITRSGWASAPPMRAALAFRPARFLAESMRVPRTLGRIADVLAWVVHEDLPATASGDALAAWLRGRPRVRGMTP